MSIAIKVFFVIAINLGILLVGTGFAYFTAKTSATSTIAILKEEVEPSLQAQKLEQQITRIMMLAITHMTLTDEEAMFRLEEQLQQNIDAFDKTLALHNSGYEEQHQQQHNDEAHLNNDSNNLDENHSVHTTHISENDHHNNGSLTGNITNLWLEMKQAIDRSVALNHNYDQELALSNLLTVGRDAQHKLSESINAMIKGHHDHMLEKEAGIQQMLKHLDQVLAVCLSTALILYVAIFIFTRRSLLLPLKKLKHHIETVESGDLTSDTVIKGHDEIGQMGMALHELFNDRLTPLISKIQNQVQSQIEYSDNLSQTFTTISDSSDQLKKQAGLIANSSKEMASQIDTTASSSSEIASTIGEMTVSIGQLRDSLQALSELAINSSGELSSINRNTEVIFSEIHLITVKVEEVADNLTEANNRCKSVMQSAEVAKKSAEESREVMEQLQVVTNKVGDFTRLIEKISNQTSILALNASIEASRAGEQGRGFATVASEVKELAHQTEEANNEIASQIETIQSRVSTVIHSSEETLKSSGEVFELSQQIAEMISSQDQLASSVAKMVESVSDSSKESSTKITATNENLQQISSAVSDASNSSAELSSAADSVAAVINTMATNTRHVADEAVKVRDGIQQAKQEIFEIDGSVSGSDKISKNLDQQIKAMGELVRYFKT